MKGAAMKKLLAKFLADNAGATSIEYAIIASGVALVIIVSVNSLGSAVNGKFVSVQTALK
jgi:pilus assembly protein Flp/PilA